MLIFVNWILRSLNNNQWLFHRRFYKIHAYNKKVTAKVYVSLDHPSYIHSRYNRVESRYLEVDGTFFTSSNYPMCKLICTLGNLDLLNSPRCQIIVRNEINLNIQIYSSNYAEFEIKRLKQNHAMRKCVYPNQIPI